MTTTEVQAQLRLKNILVTTDFSEGSMWALAYAVDIARKYGSMIAVIHAIEAQPLAGVPLDPLHEHYKEVREAEQKMFRFTDSKMFNELQHRELVRMGQTWDVIRTAAKEINADLIVLATHGRTGIKHLMMGSVAEQIFRHALCPVMTIGPHVAKGSTAPPRKVLYATDFSESAERALPYAVALARDSGATLIAMHVAELVFGEGVDHSPQLLLGVEKRLREQIPSPEGVADFRYLARLGAPADGILTAATEAGVDLVVLGLHRHSALATHLPWATAHKVVAHATCPVLTVR